MTKLRPRDYLLSIQHLFAMFGATVLVPLLTGLNPSLALFSAGVGTLIFHICTKFEVPVFLGSSFAFVPVIAAVVKSGENGAIVPSQVPFAQGGVVVAGFIYVIFAFLAYQIGTQRC